jgi:Fur family ferric uptake transcriptional regulator
MTAQRKLILKAIEDAGEHATFDEIYAQVQNESHSISQTTVYRTLETFSRYRLIHGNEVAGGKVYEVVSSQPHHHLICHKCWTDQKIQEDALEDFYTKVDKEQGFLVLAEHMIFMGLCEECRRREGDTLGQFSVHPKFRPKALKEEQNA